MHFHYFPCTTDTPHQQQQQFVLGWNPYILEPYENPCFDFSYGTGKEREKED